MYIYTIYTKDAIFIYMCIYTYIQVFWKFHIQCIYTVYIQTLYISYIQIDNQYWFEESTLIILVNISFAMLNVVYIHVYIQNLEVSYTLYIYIYTDLFQISYTMYIYCIYSCIYSKIYIDFFVYMIYTKKCIYHIYI